MKKLFLSAAFALLACSMYAKDIQELIVTTTPPMSCQNCENRIKGNIRFEKGVKNIETNLADQRVTVTYDADKTNPEKIEKAFSKIGYNVTVIGEECNSTHKTEGNCVKAKNCGNESGCSGNCCSKK